jgi:hypothetical protein
MIQYFIHNNTLNEKPIKNIVRVMDEIISFIPISETNTDYQAYLAWVAEGNVAEEWNLNGN